MKNKLNKFSSKGFTLIELLIVIAILGVLAATVIVALDPVEQLSRARDAGMKSSVSQIGSGMLAYGTSHGGVFYNPATASNNQVLVTLQNAGEIKAIPARIAPVSPCTLALGKSQSVDKGFCYATNTAAVGTNPIASLFIIYAIPESKNVKAPCTSGQGTYYVYSSADGKAGVVCTAAPKTEPVFGNQVFVGP